MNILKNFSEKKSQKPVQQDDLVNYAVFGPSRSGKSTFIKVISGVESIMTSDGMTSCTRLAEIIISNDSRFVSGPGFNDTNLTKFDVFKILTEALAKEVNHEKIKFNCVLYFQSLETDLISNSDRLNQTIVKALCGENTHILVVFTKGDLFSEEKRKKKINEMMEFFKVDMGATDCVETNGIQIENYKPIFDYCDQFKNNQQPLKFSTELSINNNVLGSTTAYVTFKAEINKEIIQMEQFGVDTDDLRTKLKEIEVYKVSWRDITLGAVLVPVGIVGGILLIPVTVLGFVITPIADGVTRLFTLNKYRIINWKEFDFAPGKTKK